MAIGNELQFQVQGKPTFELPLTNVANSNIAGKNEVALEFTPPAPFQRDPKNLSVRAPDELVEMRFYVPGKSMKSRGGDDGSDAEEETDLDEDGNEISAAEALHNLIKDKADIGAIVGESIVIFTDVLILTPRWAQAGLRGLNSADGTQRTILSGVLLGFSPPARQINRLPSSIHINPPNLPSAKG
jgi:structure-specific recognition protein 1